MKYCPKCETRYDEEIIRFCTKDGSPLVDEQKPNFIQMPSDSLEANAGELESDDAGEMTVIRRNVTPPPLPPPPPASLDDMTFEPDDNPAQRIVVPTTEEPVMFPPRTSRPPQAYVQPQRSNTAVVVLLTIIGTVVVLCGAGGLFWLLQRDHASNTNANSYANFENLNTGIDNLNSNTNYNFNFNTSINANANANKSPTATPKPSPIPSPSEFPENSNDVLPNSNIRLPLNSMTTPTSTPRPTLTPPTNRSVNGGILNGRAVTLATPAYPQMARQVHASGQVMVEVAVDESGRVVSAKAVSGNPLLRSAAETAARQSRIIPSRINNENVRTTGILVYNFRDN